MKISQLRTLQTVAEIGSFSSAAIELGCSQSNVSYAVNEFEKLMGYRVFERSGQGCVLTSDGAGAVRQVVVLLNLFDELTKKTTPQGKARILCSTCVGGPSWRAG
ncbi:LysR family transcriptional regulator [Verminephrobacter aporrectodeae subsp. tuberculatae]|uniref:LysR family transcriptional regulator n=1 Tax=Verminephrobacter aporrectodeae TaxID=1110389 RepID=UPI002238DE61|nr:LysR family transcriptional regulator [Verminephrobacter aporrectodeae]MCW5255101.1 LysR family transcriptional regulator [Verminephrobacter aporrectodeae subsp. tuberculatae]